MHLPADPVQQGQAERSFGGAEADRSHHLPVAAAQPGPDMAGADHTGVDEAVQYARDRVQSRPVDGSLKTAAPIIHHPDVRRMLMTMRAYTEACRAMASVAAAAYDAAHHHPDAKVRQDNQTFYEFLVPLVKGYSTEMSLEVTSLGVQVHGGMGFIEETGAAQYYRDARILTIYEGTTAIQANDLIGRKTVRDGGAVAKGIITQVRATATELQAVDHADLHAIARRLSDAADALEQVVASHMGSVCPLGSAWQVTVGHTLEVQFGIAV